MELLTLTSQDDVPSRHNHDPPWEAADPPTTALPVAKMPQMPITAMPTRSRPTFSPTRGGASDTPSQLNTASLHGLSDRDSRLGIMSVELSSAARHPPPSPGHVRIRIPLIGVGRPAWMLGGTCCDFMKPAGSHETRLGPHQHTSMTMPDAQERG